MLASLALSLALAVTGDSTLIKNRHLERNQTVAAALFAAGLDEATVDSVQGALRAAEFDFKRARPDDQLRFVFRHGQLDLFEYRRSLLKEWQVRRDADRWTGRLKEVERETRVELVQLQVDSSVWDAAKAAGEKPEIAVTLSDVFAWDIDFYRDVQKGDVMRAVVEKVIAHGKVIDYGRVLAASYKGSTVGNKKSFRYQLPDGTESYFLEDGSSARKTFLKSPLKFAQVTSGFGPRFHPIINQFGAHNGELGFAIDAALGPHLGQLGVASTGLTGSNTPRPLVFGCAYAQIARDPVCNRPYVVLGILGKSAFVVAIYAHFLAGDASPRLAALVTVDLVFALLFAAFRRATPR